jgi:hypothetical protein
MAEKLTERDIQEYVRRYASAHHHPCIIPNIFMYKWECDMLSVTRSGYTHEFEIKTSYADFKNDFDKTYKHQVLKNGYVEVHNYNNTIDKIKKRRPNYFWYVCPSDIIPISELPEYAGLRYIVNLEDTDTRYSKLIKKPPLLHHDKINNEELMHITQSFTNRYFGEKF